MNKPANPASSPTGAGPRREASSGAIPEPLPHIGPMQPDVSQRERFGAEELAIVLSHYDLGTINRIRPFERGSRRAPKMRIRAASGEYLLKRRGAGHDDPYRVAFAHGLQLYLADCKYPVAALIGTRDDGNSLVQHKDRTYELFRFIDSEKPNLTVEGVNAAGAALGRMHRLLMRHEPQYDAPSGSYHGASSIDPRFAQAASAIAGAEPAGDHKEIEARCKLLQKLYHEASRKVESAGFSSWPVSLNHGDWHPGNLLHQKGRLAAVVDFDSARLEPRMADIANACLQFSIRMDKPDDPSTWPDGLDAERIRAMLAGYDSEAADAVSRGEIESLPWLMIEALIVEGVVPIAATGRFARIPGSVFLHMVERKVRWIRDRAARLIKFLRG